MLIHRVFLAAAIACLTFLVACKTSSYIQKSVTVYRGSSTYESDLRDIEETSSQLTSTVVIAGDSISNELKRFPESNVSEAKKLTITNVVIRRIDSTSVELVSIKQPSVSITVPTKTLKSISTSGARITHPSWWYWLLILPPLLLTIGLLRYAKEWGENTPAGCLNGMLLGLGTAGTLIAFFALITQVGLLFRRDIIESIYATWWFAQ